MHLNDYLIFQYFKTFVARFTYESFMRHGLIRVPQDTGDAVIKIPIVQSSCEDYFVVEEKWSYEK